MPSLLAFPVEILWNIIFSLQDDPHDDYIPHLSRLASSCRTLYFKLGISFRADAQYHKIQASTDIQRSMFGMNRPPGRDPSLFWCINKSNDIGQIADCLRAWKSAFPDAIVHGVSQYCTRKSPGHAAIRRHRLDILQLLVREGFSITGGRVDVSWLRCNNLLMYAIEKKQDDIALWLVEQGAEFGQLEVEAAVWYNRPSVLAVLLSQAATAPGGISAALDERGLEEALKTAYQHARRLFGPIRDENGNGHGGVIDLLVEAGASLSNSTNDNYHPLLEAAQHGAYGNALRIFEHQVRQDIIPVEDLWYTADFATRSDQGLALVKAIHPKFTHLMYENDEDRNQPSDSVVKKARQHLIEIAGLAGSSQVLRYLQEN
ncbi:hypothetical protein SLS62_002289 [Diatrype stigma]|uniref:Uncharacterized protein n=1 Tax=Diatrype stigma TaxID=117547 RepID=A0AAN9V8X4_9PEZI